MTSLLPVCLALLLPACVLGQYVQFTPAFESTCTSPEEIRELNKCENAFDTFLNESLSSYNSSFARLCENIDRWMSDLHCRNDVYRTCVDDVHLVQLLSETNLNNSFHYLCDNGKAADYSCMSRSLGYCVEQFTIHYRTKSDLMDNTCKYLQAVEKCAHDVCVRMGFSMEFLNEYWRMLYSNICSASRSSSSSPSSFLIFAACAVLLAKMAVRIL